MTDERTNELHELTAQIEMNHARLRFKWSSGIAPDLPHNINGRAHANNAHRCNASSDIGLGRTFYPTFYSA